MTTVTAVTPMPSSIAAPDDHAHPRLSRGAERGFTLLELLVAVVAGLMVIMAAFLLSKGAAKLFASENRIAVAQMNLRMGLDRVRTDIERAGFMTTANYRSDPDVCPSPEAFIPGSFQSVMRDNAVTPVFGADDPATLNNLRPDFLNLQGNYATTDLYMVASIEATGSGSLITLMRGNGAIQRLLASMEAGTASAVLANAFPTNHILRITNPLGSSQFAIITGVSYVAPIGGATATAQITVSSSPALAYVVGSTFSKRCGITGNGTGSTVNTVKRIGYDVRTLSSDAAWAWAYPNDIAADATKRDLVRTEYFPDGTVDKQAIVAEYVVDFNWGLSIDSSAPGSAWVEPVISTNPVGSAASLPLIDNVRNNPAVARPQRVRSIRVRLSTRQRDPDRTVPIDDGGPGLLRYQLGPGQYSRVRTDTVDVTLVNHRGIRW